MDFFKKNLTSLRTRGFNMFDEFQPIVILIFVEARSVPTMASGSFFRWAPPSWSQALMGVTMSPHRAFPAPDLGSAVPLKAHGGGAPLAGFVMGYLGLLFICLRIQK